MVGDVKIYVKRLNESVILVILQLLTVLYHHPAFVGRYSLVADTYGPKKNKEYVNTLEENIRKGEFWIS
jgi:hypothetical protein